MDSQTSFGKEQKDERKKKRQDKKSETALSKKERPRPNKKEQAEAVQYGEARCNTSSSTEEENPPVHSSKDRNRSVALQLLRPLCTELMKERCVENVDAFVKVLPLVKEEILEEIQVYIVFPLHTCLHLKGISEPLLICACEALQSVFMKVKVQSTQTFFDVFSPLLFYLAPPNATEYQVKSEEARIVIIQTVETLWRRCEDKSMDHVYNLTSLPPIGQLISVLVSTAEVEKNRKLQVAALSCLSEVLQDRSIKVKDDQRGPLSCLLAFIVPGVTLGLMRIIVGDLKQGHHVITSAVFVLSRVILMAVDDDELDVYLDDGTLSLPPDMDSIRKSQLKSLVVTKTTEWVKNTTSKFRIVLEKVCQVVLAHDHPEVRLALLELLQRVVKHCSKSLSECLPLCLESLISLLKDPNPKVSSQAEATLKLRSVMGDGPKDTQFLTQMLQGNLYELTTALPRLTRMGDEDEKLRTIRLLNGYISVLGSNIDCVLLSSAHLTRLCLALVQSLELDVSEIKIMEERGSLLPQDNEIMRNTDTLKLWKPRKYFKHFRNEQIWLEFMKVCRLLGKFGRLFILIDRFLELYNETVLYKLPAVLVINEIVYGARVALVNESSVDEIHAKSKRVGELQEIISMVLEVYLQEDNLQLPDQYDGKSEVSSSFPPSSSPSSLTSSLMVVQPDMALGTKKTLANKNRAVLLVCLYMEGIAKFSSVLGPEFEVHFIKALYPVVQNLGHENIYISHTAYFALADICGAWAYSSIDNLLQKNADYLVNAVSLRLRHFYNYRRCPQTICVMLKYCSSQLLPLIEHSIAELLDTLDDHYTEDLMLFMPVLLELTTAIGRWFPITDTSPNRQQTIPEKTPGKPLDPQNLVNFVKDYIKQKNLSENFEDDDDDDDDDRKNVIAIEERTMGEIKEEVRQLIEENKKDESAEEDGEGEDAQKDTCPKHIQVVKDVLHRVKHFLASTDGRVRVQTVDIVCQCCQSLKSHERELLPQLHQMWPNFRTLFRSEEKFVVIKAIKALVVLSALSSDFLQQRTMKDVLPDQLAYLDTQGNISCVSRPAYLHTVHFKLQLTLLTNLGHIVENLGIEGTQLNKVAKSCLPYLSTSQPVQLQKASMEAFSSFISADGDAMWLLLCHSHCPHPLTPPGPEFALVKFPFSSGEQSKVSTNITELFSKHFYN